MSQKLIGIDVRLIAHPVCIQSFEHSVVLVRWNRAYSALLRDPEKPLPAVKISVGDGI